MKKEAVLFTTLCALLVHNVIATSNLLGVLSVSEGYTLRQVQVVTRHGARTPYVILPGEPTVWTCDLSPLSMPNVGRGDVIDAPGRLYRTVFIPAAETFAGNCSQGQLTAIGAQQHMELGEMYRSAYVNTTKFISGTFDATEVYVRSTASARTVESAESFMFGMFPVTSGGTQTEVVNIHLVESSDEIMLPPGNCPRLIQGCNGVQLQKWFVDKWTEMLPLQAYLEQQWGITADEFPWWGGIHNTIECFEAAGKAMPSYFNSSMITTIDNFANFEITSLYNSTSNQRLGIGLMVKHLLTNMLNVADGYSNIPKFYLYSGHDITLGLLMSAFDMFDGIWPTFASHLTIELLEDSSSNLYVRLFYNGELKQISSCSTEPCSLTEFQSILTPKIPTNLNTECQALTLVEPLDDLTSFMCTN